MKLLKKASNQQAYAKVGIFGESGSGKTHTAMLLAIGICQKVSGKAIAFLDTETGSDWWADRVPKGIDFYVHKSRSFKDLLAVMDECEAEGIPVLVIDSLTHVWQELCETYLDEINADKKRQAARYDKKFYARSRLEFPDWQIVKGKDGWRAFTDRYVNGKVHVLALGRGGFEYDMQEGEDGKKELVKTDTKMKAGSDFGYEPSLVVEMERISQTELAHEGLSLKQRKSIQARAGGKDIHRAYIRKDRSDLMDGSHFDDPTFADFEPHINKLNLGGEHLGIDAGRTSSGMFEGVERNNDGDWRSEQKDKAIYLDTLKETLAKFFPGTTNEAKKARGDIGEAVFDTRSWEAITAMSTDQIRLGLGDVRYLLEQADKDRRDTALASGIENGKLVDPNAAVLALKEILDEHHDAMRAVPGEELPDWMKEGKAVA